MGRSIKVSPTTRADRIEAVLRQADTALETWVRRAKRHSAGALRHQVDNLQTGLKKLSAGLEHLERDQKATPTKPLEREPAAAPSKRRARPASARKPSRKQKKAA